MLFAGHAFHRLFFRPGSENAAAPSDSSLQEAELEHLSDVFLNSVYPLFQYDFQLNREGRSAIHVFVASMPDDLSREDLDAISAMIKTQLLSPEAEEQAELADIERAWERRYERFLAEKQVIDRAGLDQTEKDKQIESLLRQHYTPQELEAARAFDQSRK